MSGPREGTRRGGANRTRGGAPTRTRALMAAAVVLSVVAPAALSTTAGAVTNPTVTQVNPSSYAVGAKHVPVVVTGTGFESGVKVTSHNGIRTPATFVSATQLDLSVTVTSTVAPGTYNLVVDNPDGGHFHCGGCITVTAATTPTVTSVAPNQLSQNSTVTNFSVTGTNFTSSATLSFSATGVSASAVTFVNSTSLTATVTVSPTATLGSGNVTVTTGSGPGTCTGCLLIVAPAIPTVTSVTPNQVAQNSTVNNFSVTGTNFTSGATLTFSAAGVTSGTVTFVNSTSLTATVTVSPTATLGSGNVTVTTGGGSGTCTGCLLVATVLPAITQVNPNSLAQGAANVPVTVTGSGFESGATVVSHAGITIKTTFNNSGELDLSVSVDPGVEPAPYNLSVTNPDGGTVSCTGCLTVTGASADWPAYLNGPQHSSYNPFATSITPSNIGNLNPVWRWLPPNDPSHGRLFSSPTVVKGIVYEGSENGYFYAISEATQSILWSQFLGTVKGLGANGCGNGKEGVISTATVTTDPGTGKLAVYENAPDGHLYAMDAATGTVIWKGVVGIPSTTQNDYYAWGSPLVANGKVYVGISSECDNPLVQGGLLAFPQDSTTSTNTASATWHTLPDSVTCPPLTTPGCGGSIWSSPAVAADGSIIVTTGNGPPSNTNCANNPPDSSSVVKLDPNTLTPLAVFGIPPADVGSACDIDWGGSPTIFTATVNGVSTPMVGGCDKNGHYYGLRQSDLSMVWDYVMGEPNQPGGAQQCDAAAIWDGTHLIAAGGSPTTINGTLYQGSVQSLYPATGSVDGTQTGKPVWQTGLPGNIVGSPSEDGAGVVAATVYISSTKQQGVYLLSAATGGIIGFVPTPLAVNFGQPVFANNDLLVPSGLDLGLTAYEITTPGPAITKISPATLTHGTSTTLTITGSGFGGNPQVIFTNTLVDVTSKVTVVNSTTLSVAVTADTTAPTGPANVVVNEPGSPSTSDTCSNCLTIN